MPTDHPGDYLFSSWQSQGNLKYGSGGNMVASLKLKGIDGRAPPGVEPAA
jgi:hypothetical protein